MTMHNIEDIVEDLVTMHNIEDIVEDLVTIVGILTFMSSAELSMKTV